MHQKQHHYLQIKNQALVTIPPKQLQRSAVCESQAKTALTWHYKIFEATLLIPKIKTTPPTIKPTTCVITTWQTNLASTLLQVEF